MTDEGADIRTTRRPRIRTVARTTALVSPLGFFFDLVFVLAITQCTDLWRQIRRPAGSSRDYSYLESCGGLGRLLVAVIRFGDLRHQIRHHDLDGGHSAEGAARHVPGTAHG